MLKKWLLVIFSLTFVVPSVLRAQWERLPDPPGAQALAFAEIPNVPGRIYAATINGVWLTTDHMTTWTPVGMQGRTIWNITAVQDSSLGEAVFASDDSSLYRSLDSGKTWNKLFSTIPNLIANGNNLIRSDTSQWIYISSDLGNSWSVAGPAPPNGSQGYTLAVSNGMLIGFVRSNGIWTRPLSGGSWAQTSYPVGNTIKSQAVLDSTIFVANSKLNYSTDFGKTWNMPANKGLDTINEEFYSFAVRGGTIIANVWYGIVRSTDSGQTWTRVDGSGGYPNYYGPYPGGGYTIPAAFTDGNFVTGESGGIFKSSDGVTWQFASHGITNPSVRAIATMGDTLFAIVNGAMFHSTDNGETWGEQADLEQAYQFAHVSGMLFVLTDADGLLWRWRNGNWKSFHSPVDLALAMVDSTLYGCRWNELLTSSDSGATWNQVWAQSAIDWLQYIYAFGDTLFALPNVGAAGWPVYFSTDHGIDWEPSGEFPTDGGFFYMLGAQDSNDELIYNYGRLNLSTDRGFDWQTIDTHFATFEESWNNQIYVGLSDTPATWSGLFKLSGTSLIQILPDTAVGQINDFAADSKYAYIGTEYKSIWRTPLANFSSGVEQPIIQPNKALTLFPNPSTSASTISFSLRERAYVSLKLFDDLGIERAVIFDGELDAGQHKIPFTDPKLPNGIYEVVLSTLTARSVGWLVIER